MDDVNLGPTRRRRRRCWLRIWNLAAVLLLVLQILNLASGATDEPTHCDILLASSANLAARCSCKDLDVLSLVASQSADDLRVNQLTCESSDLGDLFSDLSSSLSGGKLTFIDYMSLSSQLTSKNSAQASNQSTKRLQVDHLSLQLTINTRLESIEMEEQMIGLFKIVNATRVQFLNIVIEDETNCGSVGTESTRNRDREEQSLPLSITKLMSQLVSLSRLELSLASECGASLKRPSASFMLQLEPETFEHQRKLKWLNLASRGGLVLSGDPEMGSQFGPIASCLEYLSLRGNKLEKFRIFELVSSFQTGASSNLSSLNLAGNALKTLELDFFAENGRELPNENHLPQLPSLTQLDLSHNKLTGLTLKECQLLLFTMPNLNQLYLQNNQIFTLNLNSLLFYPTSIMPRYWNLGLHKNATSPSQKTRLVSRLELLDLEHNQLQRITGVTWDSLTSTRVKSINLAHNNLKRPVLTIDKRLVNRVIFRENLELIDDKLIGERIEFSTSQNTTSQSSLCDFLSSSQLDDDLLNEVILSNNQIHTLKATDFSGRQCRQVQTLKLSRNQLVAIENNSFHSLKNLEHLDMSYNRISNLTGGSLFNQNRKLKALSLSNNKLRFMAPELLTNLLELEELFVDHNQLMELDKDFFKANQKLAIIDLSNNKLNYLSDRLFSNLLQLKILNLNGNKLRQFDHRIFEFGSYGLSQVYQKRVSHDQYEEEKPRQRSKSIKKTTTVDKQKGGKSKTEKQKKAHARRQVVVEELNSGDNLLVLASNQIDLYGQMNCSKFIQNINVIWLNDNRLTRLTSETFKCSTRVQRLYLQMNSIASIDSRTFERLTQLEYLDLSSNQLNQMPSRSLVPATNLRHLDLANNQLYQFKFSQIFEKLETLSIETLNLNHNQNLRLELNELLKFLRKNQLSLRFVDLNTIGGIDYEANNSNRLIQLDGDGMRLEQMNLSAINIIPEALFTSLTGDSIIIERLQLDVPIRASDKKFLTDKLQSNLLDLRFGYSPTSFSADFMSLIENMPNESLQLSHLELRSGHLVDWPFDAKVASKLTELTYLDLGGNKLRHLIKPTATNDTSWSGAYKFAKLEVLNISSNALIGLVEHPTQKITRLRSLVPKLRVLDISNNRLTWIPYEFFDDLTELSTLKLDHNQLETLPSITTNSQFGLSLDLSHNLKLRSASGGNIVLNVGQLDSDLQELILFLSSEKQVKCQPVEALSLMPDFGEINLPDGEIIKQYEPSIVNELDSVNELTSLADRDNSCHMLMRQLDTLRLESTGLTLELAIEMANNYHNNRFLSLDVSFNGISAFSALETAANHNIIGLNLAHNKLQDISLCRTLNAVMTLNLSNNLLDEVPADISKCRHLTYLDISHNRISRLSDSLGSLSLLVLDLSNNHLNHIDGAYLSRAFKSLRQLDLRQNPLKSDMILPNLPNQKQILLDSPVIHQQIKFQLIAAEDSILIESHEKFPLEVKPVNKNGTSRAAAAFLDSNRHLLRYCTLSNEEDLQICPGNETKNCFLFRNDPNVKSCLTTLTVPGANKTSLKTNLSSDPSQLIGGNNLDLNEKLSEKDDPVLSFIDYMKSSWLRFKDANLTEQLARFLNLNEDDDSVWLEFGTNKAYKIYTSHLIKFAILSGATCIVCLLIAMFVLLTYLTNGASSRLSKSSQAAGLMRSGSCELAHCDHSSNCSHDSSRNTNSDGHPTSLTTNATATSSYNNTSTTCSSYQSKATKSSSSGSRDEVETVIERQVAAAPPLQLDIQALALLHHQNQQLMQQIQCSTPNSSLAPSSVETAETLQAVDSIQSNTSTLCQQHGQSMDQLTPTNQSIEQQFALEDNHYAHYQPQQQPIATVMRMVKSNSANFPNLIANNNNSNQPQAYGTLNPRSLNYGTLRAKRNNMAATHGTSNNYSLYSTILRDSRPVAPSSDFTEFPPPPIVDDLNLNSLNSLHQRRQQLDDQVDPSTLSLLSINTTLSANNSHHLVAEPNQTSTSGGHEHQNLCHFHRLTNNRLNDLSNNSNLPANQAAHHNYHLSSRIILEQEEEQYQQ